MPMKIPSCKTKKQLLKRKLVQKKLPLAAISGFRLWRNKLHEDLVQEKQNLTRDMLECVDENIRDALRIAETTIIWLIDADKANPVEREYFFGTNEKLKNYASFRRLLHELEKSWSGVVKITARKKNKGKKTSHAVVAFKVL